MTRTRSAISATIHDLIPSASPTVKPMITNATIGVPILSARASTGSRTGA